MEEVDKKIKVLVATNCYALDPVCYASHLDMFYKLGQQSDLQIIFFGPWRKPIDGARNDAARMAKAYECDILFFYDDDMLFADPMTAIKLIRRIVDDKKINIVQALAYIRGYPYKPMVFHLVEVEGHKRMVAYTEPEELLEIADESGLVKCDAVGCCATAMRVGLFDALPEPWFLTGQHNTEDIFFCAKAAHYLQDAGVYCDTSLEVGHLLDRPVLTTAARTMLKEAHIKYSLDQVWLPDATFAPRQDVVTKLFKFETRKNMFEDMDNIPFKEQAK